MVYQLQTPSLVQPRPATNKPLVNLFFATDQKYVAFTGLAVATFLKHLNPNFFLNVVIVHDGSVTRQQMEQFGKLRNTNNVENNIAFLDCRNELLVLNEKNLGGTRGTMFRLLLPLIMKNLDRVLYVDSDLIAAGDISELFTMDMKGCAIAASRDLPVYANCVATEVKVPVRPFMNMLVDGGEQDNAMTWREYLKKYLGIDNNWGDYVNAGVMLFDVKKMWELNLVDGILGEIGRGYVYLDQDILNKHLLTHCLQLSPIWNLHAFLTTPLFAGHVEKHVDKQLVAEYVSACNSPKIIHFAGPWKPWKRNDIIHTDKFFNSLVETPWFDEVMNQFELNKMYNLQVKKI
ncbi:MAG: glycosyltransferase family 8 protein [Hydrotalea sp.]|nr:glycosyltransferase family 8 protein [Hydrotalea sp.]